MNTKKIEGKKVPIIAHRGVSGLEKENTNAAFVAAGNRSYFGIETDVHVTLDGGLVIIHDDNTGRVAKQKMVVEKTPFDVLRNMLLNDIDDIAGRSDLRIPTLQEYIRICKKYEKTGVLELKNAFKEEDIEKVIAAIKKENYLDHIIFISFHLGNMLYLRKALPKQPCQFLAKSCDDTVLQELARNRLDLDVDSQWLTKERIAKCHDMGIKVNCWTVDDPKAAAKFIDWGVDYITTNILE